MSYVNESYDDPLRSNMMKPETRNSAMRKDAVVPANPTNLGLKKEEDDSKDEINSIDLYARDTHKNTPESKKEAVKRQKKNKAVKCCSSFGECIWDFIKAIPNCVLDLVVDFLLPCIAVSLSYCCFYTGILVCFGTPRNPRLQVRYVLIHGKQAVMTFLIVVMVTGLSSFFIQLSSLILTLAGSWKTGKPIVIAALLHLILIIFPLLIGGVTLAVQIDEMRADITNRMKGDFLDDFSDLFNSLNDENIQKRDCGGEHLQNKIKEMQVRVDDFQHYYRCCGLDTLHDWEDSWGAGVSPHLAAIPGQTCPYVWWMECRKAEDSNSSKYCRVPPSCCKSKYSSQELKDKANCSLWSGSDAHGWDKEVPKILNTINCREGAQRALIRTIRTLLIVLGSMIGFNVLTAILSWKKLCRRQRIAQLVVHIEYHREVSAGKMPSFKNIHRELNRSEG